MESSINIDLAKRIRQLRIENNLTQLEVAKALDATPGYICNVENGRTAMSLRMLTFFAQLTNTTLDSLVGNLFSDYHSTAIDNEIMNLVSTLSDDEKLKLIKTLKIWTE
ncbi:MAG: helix-turn-helix domain-containing protein [Lachnospiraceae bacterium]|nr:helix-turn-helix domain-containing protein [Lachnospiraceae bacterium]